MINDRLVELYKEIEKQKEIKKLKSDPRKTMITTSSESSLSEVVNKINEEL